MSRGKKRKTLGFLVASEVILIILTVFAFVLPIQDYALREYQAWLSNRSEETWKAFEEKKREEFKIRVAIGSGFGLAAAGLGFYIARKRS